MAWSFIAAATGSGPTNPATAAANFSGCDFIVVVASIYNGIYTPPLVSGDMTDGTNSYTLLTVQTSVSITIGIWYAKNASGGASHVVTLNRSSVYGGLVAAAWSGSDTTAPFRDESGNTTGSATSLAAGTTTVGANTDLIIAGLGSETANADSATLDGSYSMAGRMAYGAANNNGSQLWYHVAAGAENPTWTFSSGSAASVIASFKAAAGGGATNWGPWVVGGMNWNRLVQGR